TEPRRLSPLRFDNALTRPGRQRQNAGITGTRDGFPESVADMARRFARKRRDDDTTRSWSLPDTIKVVMEAVRTPINGQRQGSTIRRRCAPASAATEAALVNPRHDARGPGHVAAVILAKRLDHQLLLAPDPQREKRAEPHETGGPGDPIRQQQGLCQ